MKIAYVGLGQIYYMQKRLDDAIAKFEHVIQIDSNYVTAYYNIACLYSLKNEKKSAIKWLQKATVLDESIIERSKADADLDNLRQDPEFLRLIHYE